ncbi:uncharacterized protein C14orf93-like isoform X1 [Hypanus sabinus]|uniref:uncharacterized protein C14orf93-like isoform X1 n=1 Tax=Hypanus sabinus TaxID=79690 RepID=UPI0028C37A40|nr:uncharacterized protein C14orf93-like isoform X1 [Hypanus sabinus]
MVACGLRLKAGLPPGQVCEHWGPGPCRVVRVSPSPSPPVPVSLCPPALGPEGREEPDVGLASEDPSAPALLPTGGGLGSSEPGPGTATRRNGARTSRRKRDVVLSKMVHSVHNHVSNDRRFNGAESIKSAWNMGVVKFLLERLKRQLSASPHPRPYTDKELKGACVAYFLTKRREYRNAMNPHRSLKEREEKKLRSRRYRLFASRAAMVRLFSLEDQQLWEGASEELMSDEEDSPLEPGVWVARSPRFRSPQLTDLCRRLDASSRHGLRPNRLVGPPSDRLPSLPLPLNFPLPLPPQAEGRPPCIQVKVEGDE